MDIRRCAVLWLEARESSEFSLGKLMAGGTGVVTRMDWLAHAPHLAEAASIESKEVAALGRLSPHDWVPRESLVDYAA